MVRSQRGFTLVEAIVALTISSLLVILVSTVFLAQNRYYALQLQRSRAHDSARTVTELVSSELRSVMRGGFVVAESDRMVVRSPMILAVVCDVLPGDRVVVHLEGGVAALDTDEVAGFAIRDAGTSQWSYYDIPDWTTILQPGGQPQRDCAANGADTVGISDEFERLWRLDEYAPALPVLGDVLMLYREVEYRYQQSEMDPSGIGLFRGVYGETLQELVTGMDSTAEFRYRAGSPSYVAPVGGPSLSSIDAVRLVAWSRQRPETGGQQDLTFGWSVNVFLRNSR